MNGRMILLTGPSGVGKTSLLNAVAKFNPERFCRIKKGVLYTSRQKRLGETEGIDYHFRIREEIERLDRPRHQVFTVRGDLQAIDYQELYSLVSGNDGQRIGYLEIFHSMALPIAQQLRSQGVDVSTIFVSPLSQEEIKSVLRVGGSEKLFDTLTDIGVQLLSRRIWQQHRMITQEDADLIIRRAKTAIGDLKAAHEFDYILPTHAGEDSFLWHLDILFGDAKKTYDAFVAILDGQTPTNYERWSADLLANLESV